MKTPSLRVLFLATAGAALAACDEAPAPSTVRQGLSASLAAMLPEVVGALQSDASARVPLDSAEQMLDMFDGEADVVTVLAASPVVRTLAAAPSLEHERMSGWLTRNVFSDANHKGDGVYALPAALFCSATTDPTTGDPAGEVNAACAEQFNKLALKIKVRGDESELEFSLLLGPSENEPFFLTLSKRSLKLAVDLGEGADAVAELADVFDGQAPNLRAAGRIATSVAVSGEQKVTFQFTIEKAVSLAYAEDPTVSLDSAAATRFSSAAAPVYTFSIDGKAQTVTGALALGETKMHTPADDLNGEPMMDLDLPGVTGSITVAPGEPVKITGIGLGGRTLTVDANGTRAMSLDLNPQHNRRFDVTVSEAAGKVTFAVSPALDLRAQIDRAALGEEVRTYEVTQVLLDGQNPALTLSAEALQVSSGSFKVVTNPDTYGVEATAGQCLAETVVSGFTTKLSVVTCPQ